MSLIFYYAPMSTASSTEAVLAELGTPCERVKLDISAGWIGTMDVDLMPFPNVMGWLQRRSKRPAMAKLMAG
jgi:hypothetical protein